VAARRAKYLPHAIAGTAGKLAIVETDSRPRTTAYSQLAGQLRVAIKAGRYGPRQPIPSLSRLVGDSGLAMGTVRRAMQLLEDEGLIYTIAGRGTFIAPR